MELALIVWILMGTLGFLVRRAKGGSGAGGFWLGFLLGPIGLVLAMIGPSVSQPQPQVIIQQAPFAPPPLRAGPRRTLADYNVADPDDVPGDAGPVIECPECRAKIPEKWIRTDRPNRCPSCHESFNAVA